MPQTSLDSFAPEFREGMAARAPELGDVGDSSPENWEKPLGGPDVHVAVAVPSPDTARHEVAVDQARRAQQVFPGVELIWRQELPAPPDGRRSGSRTGSAACVEGSGRIPTNSREHPSRPARSSWGTRTSPANCRRCPPQTPSAATAPTWCSESAHQRRGLPAVPGPSEPVGPRRRCWAPRWSAAGKAAHRSRSPQEGDDAELGADPLRNNASGTATTLVASSARWAPTPAGPTHETRSTRRQRRRTPTG